MMFVKEVLAIEEELRIADVRQSIKLSRFVRVPAKGQWCFDEIGVRSAHSLFFEERSQVGQIRLDLGESWKPGIVQHYQIVRAGATGEVDQFFLEQICVGQLSYGDVDSL